MFREIVETWKSVRSARTERLAALRAAPVTFQELLPGDNIRVYVLDGRVIAASAIDVLPARPWADEVVEGQGLDDATAGHRSSSSFVSCPL